MLGSIIWPDGLHQGSGPSTVPYRYRLSIINLNDTLSCQDIAMREVLKS